MAPSFKMLRFLFVIYAITLVFHAVYGGLIFLFSRGMGVRHMTTWVALYGALPLILALVFPTTTVGFQDGLVYVGFAVAIGAITWPFVRQSLSVV